MDERHLQTFGEIADGGRMRLIVLALGVALSQCSEGQLGSSQSAVTLGGAGSTATPLGGAHPSDGSVLHTDSGSFNCNTPTNCSGSCGTISGTYKVEVLIANGAFNIRYTLSNDSTSADEIDTVNTIDYSSLGNLDVDWRDDIAGNGRPNSASRSTSPAK